MTTVPLLTSALANQTASIEELTETVYFAGAISAAKSLPVLIARFPLQVVAVGVCSYSSSVAANASNFWVVQLRKGVANGSGVDFSYFASKSTVGQGANQGQEWNFDTVTFDATMRSFAKGDVMSMVFTPTLSPGSWTDVLVTLRYQPL